MKFMEQWLRVHFDKLNEYLNHRLEDSYIIISIELMIPLPEKIIEPVEISKAMVILDS
jgi:hypothetical protein